MGEIVLSAIAHHTINIVPNLLFNQTEVRRLLAEATIIVEKVNNGSLQID